jgi:16S rRNA (cytosine967-C5)-methyltransferase
MKQAATLATQLAQAAPILARVATGRSLADEMSQLPPAALASRAALIDLTHGTLRRYGRLQAVVASLSRRGRPDALVEALLWCALYALESKRYNDHTVVDEAVKACGLIERWPAKGYVNAVLRGFLRQREALESQLANEIEARYQHPAWWIERLQKAYPDDWQATLAAGNTHPPMALRVNRRRVSVDVYQARLAEHGLTADRRAAGALLMEKPVSVEHLPGFAEGDVSVQDIGAQRAAFCLDLSPGQRVLDACAAPGGKTGHMLELADVAMTALDVDETRAARITTALKRLGLHADVRSGDATRPEAWWDGRAFDRILVDAPCSASGIVRRRPDVKWLRRPSDLARFAEQQHALLGGLWRVLVPGGKLLYATCSVFPEENDAVVARFVESESDARQLALPDGARAQWLPDDEHDGFYYALVEKRA